MPYQTPKVRLHSCVLRVDQHEQPSILLFEAACIHLLLASSRAGAGVSCDSNPGTSVRDVGKTKQQQAQGDTGHRCHLTSSSALGRRTVRTLCLQLLAQLIIGGQWRHYWMHAVLHAAVTGKGSFRKTRQAMTPLPAMTSLTHAFLHIISPPLCPGS
jgi:hypothetical protein